MQFIQAPGLPAPAGHYAQAVRANGFVFVSGMLPDPALPDFDSQVRDVLQRCHQVLQAAGCDWPQVVQCTAYLAGVGHWPAFNAVYAQVLGPHRPARAVVPVPELHHGCLIELQLVAVTTAE
ncbi:RidA family protein [Hydrogenophaga crocea]|uniref:RidA family protein n=1 Tax=Hydrogenophaga crocea TaxID=2716225 RepID=A0A6G8IJT1_9BURK|nr:RidA family protein [Hydrogenophaga crocea]QIM53411.1 RidA family protein [Hydrogenophaga crocea]